MDEAHILSNPIIGNKWTLNDDDDDDDDVTKVYLRSVEGLNKRGRPLGKREDRVKEYGSERGMRGNGLEWARRECMDRESWRSICCGHPLGRSFWGGRCWSY